MKKNDIVRVRIESLSNDGNGVSHADGIIIFVPYSAIGDDLTVRIERIEKTYCYGRIVDIITPSVDRVPADCDLFERCGGCSFRAAGGQRQKSAGGPGGRSLLPLLCGEVTDHAEKAL